MKMVRTSMLAIAAGALISPTAFAAIVDDDGTGPSETYFYSNEYLSTATDQNIDSGPLRVEIEAEYAVGDVITLSVSGGAVTGGFQTSVASACGAAGKPAGEAGITLGKLSSDANGAVYRVTEVDNACGATTVGVVFVFGELLLNAQAVDAANTITASFSAQTGTGLALDTGGGAARSGNLVITGSQFKPTIDEAFDGVVDVNQARLGFEGCVQTDANCFDVGEWTVDDAVIPAAADDEWLAGTPGDTTAQDVTVTSDFGWVVDEDPDTAGIQFPAGTFATSCTATGLTATKLTADCTNGTNDVTIDVFANEDADGDRQVLPATSFVSDHIFAYTGIGNVDSTLSVTMISLGAWTLNGFQAQVAYMPFQTGIGQVIYIANRSNQTGAITVDWIDQNGNSGSFDIGVVPAGSTRAIGPAINAGLPAAQQEGGRLALTITANVPACQAQLNAQYNVSGDRAFSVSTNNCSE